MCFCACMWPSVCQPLLKCGLDVPDSSHWVNYFQVSVLVINFIPLRQCIMIEIAKEKTEKNMSLISPSLCGFSEVKAVDVAL